MTEFKGQPDRWVNVDGPMMADMIEALAFARDAHMEAREALIDHPHYDYDRAVLDRQITMCRKLLEHIDFTDKEELMKAHDDHEEACAALAAMEAESKIKAEAIYAMLGVEMPDDYGEEGPTDD